MINADLLIMDHSPETLDLASRMGIKLVGVASLDNADRLEKDLVAIPRRIEYDIDSLKPSKRVLIGYKPAKREDARRAGKINNITIVFDHDNIMLCDSRQINVMIGKNNSVEILLRDLLDQSKFTRYLRHMIRCINTANRLGVPTILSSGAKSQWELWHPKTLVMIEKLIVGRRGPLTLSWIEVIRKWNSKILSRYF